MHHQSSCTASRRVILVSVPFDLPRRTSFDSHVDVETVWSLLLRCNRFRHFASGAQPYSTNALTN